MKLLRSTPLLAVLTLVTTGLMVNACAGTPWARGRASVVTVEVNDLGYQPATVEAVVGQTVRLALKNTGSVEHQLGIADIPMMTQGGTQGHNMAGMEDTMVPTTEQLQVHLVAAPGATTALELTPTKAGEYPFHCVVPGHTEHGTLIVS